MARRQHTLSDIEFQFLTIYLKPNNHEKTLCNRKLENGPNLEEVYDLCNQLKVRLNPSKDSQHWVTRAVHISVVMPLLPERIKVGSQISAMESGACTGQVSAKQLIPWELYFH